MGNGVLISVISVLSTVVVILIIFIALLVTGNIAVPSKVTVDAGVTQETVYITTACDDTLITNFIIKAQNTNFEAGAVAELAEQARRSKKHIDDINCVFMVLYGAATNRDITEFNAYYERYKTLLFEKKNPSPKFGVLSSAESLDMFMKDVRNDSSNDTAKN